MQIAPFALERYFARHEFSTRYLLSSSDCEALSMSELLSLADPEAARLWRGLRLGYTETPGHPLLRQAIAGLYRGVGDAEVLEVIPEEGIFLTMHTLLRPGDHVICTFPGYQSLYEVARSIGCEVTRWQPDEERGWRFDVSALEEMLRDNTRLVVVNFPHNPTGYLPSREDYERLIEVVRRRGIHLLSDEMYRLLELGGRTSLPAGCEVYERGLTLCGVSKSFGLPGLRVGWLASRDRELLDRIVALKDYTTICGSAPSEILALIALRSREAIVERHRARVRRNADALQRFFDEHEGMFSWNRPAGGSVCFPRLRFVDDTHAFCEELVRVAGIMLVPSRMFDYGDHHVRIGLGREDLPQVLSRFGQHLARRTG